MQRGQLFIFCDIHTLDTYSRTPKGVTSSQRGPMLGFVYYVQYTTTMLWRPVVTSPKLPLTEIKKLSKMADILLLHVKIFQELSKIWQIGKRSYWYIVSKVFSNEKIKYCHFPLKLVRVSLNILALFTLLNIHIYFSFVMMNKDKMNNERNHPDSFVEDDN